MNKEKLKLNNQVRMLWFQHSEWTRMAFASIIFKNPDEAEVINRLLRNPADFAYFLRYFYGHNIGAQFCTLLTEHLVIAADLVKATMAAETNKAEQINQRLYKNADEISAFLDSINPYWNSQDWKKMFYMHLDLAKLIASQMIEGNYEKSINTYDIFEAEVMNMADMMIDGIIKQFPYLFYW